MPGSKLSTLRPSASVAAEPSVSSSSAPVTKAAKQASIFLRTSSASSYSSRSRSFRITGANHGTPRTCPGRKRSNRCSTLDAGTGWLASDALRNIATSPGCTGIQPVRAPSPERIELHPLDDEAAVGQIAGLAGIEVIRLQQLQLQRHRQAVLDPPVADAHQALAALRHGADDQRLQAGEVGQSVRVAGLGEAGPEPVGRLVDVGVPDRARGRMPVPTRLLTTACTALAA